jgi:small subunit ribosomal protein S12
MRAPRRAVRHYNRRKDLNGCPHKRASCVLVTTMTPRKPNSAIRKIARCYIKKTKTTVTAYIPGMTHNLQKHAVILFRGGRTKDLPGVRYKIVRGKHDLRALPLRRRRRSLYGTKKPKEAANESAPHHHYTKVHI